ncbi:LysR substrate-binding domain-containing protein [Pseudovibrio exalbescens]|uniref:LysR substrate-binding domain-containing protein n=1 Tax=Pseudovibrio exalbescens TaxID=197461 RepID=UPI0023673943|nr:LysR substrate-binding domain-containing protein [Pseudovibrio exalbescens]MDD7911245.1 LysR substrate-binding domain-containing protein [Pseudovibrio exalbescens]
MRNLNQVSLAGLRAVEAVGRLGSLKAAAEEMGVTSGAISQQIHRTEEQLGRTIFTRKPGGGLVLTDSGALICEGLTAGMHRLSEAIALADRDREETLTISAAPVFTEKWLVKRLNDFVTQHPEIRLRVEASEKIVDLNTSDVDVGIRVTKKVEGDVTADKLCNHYIFPVCSPSLAEQLKDPSDLARMPIVRDMHSQFTWDTWLEPLGLKSSIISQGTAYSNSSLCLEAVIGGQGVFLGWDTLAADALHSGLLVAPFRHRVPTGIAYWFVTRHGALRNKSVLQFHKWLKHKLSSDVELQEALPR